MVRHRRMLAPIQTIKHFVPRTDTDIPSGTAVNLVIADAVVAPAVGASNEVNIGSVIKAIRVEMWLGTPVSAGGLSQMVVVLEKVPANQTPLTFAQSLNLMSYDNKHNILFTFQGILGALATGASPLQVLNNWILIPKGKQRMARGDSLILTISTVSAIANSCGMFIFKEYK